jgi:hypothetical protein
VFQHAGEGDFSVSGLKATFHRGLDPLLGLGVAHAFAEEIRITAEF